MNQAHDTRVPRHETCPGSVKGSRCLLSAESSDLAEQAVVDPNTIHRNAVAAQPASITNKSNTRQFVTEEKEQISREAKLEWNWDSRWEGVTCRALLLDTGATVSYAHRRASLHAVYKLSWALLPNEVKPTTCKKK